MWSVPFFLIGQTGAIDYFQQLLDYSECILTSGKYIDTWTPLSASTPLPPCVTSCPSGPGRTIAFNKYCTRSNDFTNELQLSLVFGWSCLVIGDANVPGCEWQDSLTTSQSILLSDYRSIVELKIGNHLNLPSRNVHCYGLYFTDSEDWQLDRIYLRRSDELIADLGSPAGLPVSGDSTRVFFACRIDTNRLAASSSLVTGLDANISAVLGWTVSLWDNLQTRTRYLGGTNSADTWSDNGYSLRWKFTCCDWNSLTTTTTTTSTSTTTTTTTASPSDPGDTTTTTTTTTAAPTDTPETTTTTTTTTPPPDSVGGEDGGSSSTTMIVAVTAAVLGCGLLMMVVVLVLFRRRAMFTRRTSVESFRPPTPEIHAQSNGSSGESGNAARPRKPTGMGAEANDPYQRFDRFRRMQEDIRKETEARRGTTRTAWRDPQSPRSAEKPPPRTTTARTPPPRPNVPQPEPRETRTPAAPVPPGEPVDAVLAEVQSQLEAAKLWSFAKRKKLFKKMLLKFHPDKQTKSPDPSVRKRDEEQAKRVFQYLQDYKAEFMQEPEPFSD